MLLLNGLVDVDATAGPLLLLLSSDKREELKVVGKLSRGLAEGGIGGLMSISLAFVVDVLVVVVMRGVMGEMVVVVGVVLSVSVALKFAVVWIVLVLSTVEVEEDNDWGRFG